MKGIDNMKVYYFSKDIKRGCFYYNEEQYRDEHASREELIRAYNEMFEDEGESPLTEDEIASIFYENMPDYDYYAIQYLVNSYGNDAQTATAFTFKTYEECTAWITDHANEYDKELKIVGQRWGYQYRYYFDD